MIAVGFEDGFIALYDVEVDFFLQNVLYILCVMLPCLCQTIFLGLNFGI